MKKRNALLILYIGISTIIGISIIILLNTSLSNPINTTKNQTEKTRKHPNIPEKYTTSNPKKQKIPQKKKQAKIQKKIDFHSFTLYKGYYHYLESIPESIISTFTFKINTNKKQIALTFDDGPMKQTPALIETLKKHKTPATFFIVCKNLNSTNAKLYNSKLIKTAIHSYSHSNYQNLEKNAIKTDIENCISKFSKYNLSTTYFRPPYGIITKNLSETLKEKNLKGIIWNIDSQDWNKYKGEKLFHQVIKNLKNGSIILFHDIVATKDIEKIIIEIRKRGFKIVHIEDM
jgi:peptidoglycan-N-acetylglucosamine deacetylase